MLPLGAYEPRKDRHCDTVALLKFESVTRSSGVPMQRQVSGSGYRWRIDTGYPIVNIYVEPSGDITRTEKVT